MKVYIIMGPNLNLLGQREEEWYGHTSFSEFCQMLHDKALKEHLVLDIYQSNHEGQLIDAIQALPIGSKAIVNLAALTHTSIALRDSIMARHLDFIEVHLSNVYKRENFRQTSYLSDQARGIITGLGIESFFLALTYWSALQNKAPKANSGTKIEGEK